MICTFLEVFYVWRYHKQAFSAGSAIGNGTNCLSIVLCTISVSCIRRKKDNLPKFQVYLQRIYFKVSFILNDSKQNGSDSQKPRETFESDLIGSQGPKQDPQIILILFILAIKSRIEKIHIGNHYFRLEYYRFTMPFAFENVLNDVSSILMS